MHLYFEAEKGNPNDAVAERRLEWLIKTHRLGDLMSAVEGASGAVRVLRVFTTMSLVPFIVGIILKL